MAEFKAGEVVVPVVPSAQGFVKDLQRQMVAPMTKVGQDAAAEFARGFMSRTKKLTVPVEAETSAARTALEGLGREAQRLSGQSVRIGAEADTGAARSALAALDAAVGRVDGREADVSVDADAGRATAELVAVDAAVSRLDGRTAHINVNVDAAAGLAQLGLVTAALAALPAVAAAGLGAAGLAGAAVAAGVGVGALAAVAVPSLQRIAEASKANEAATKAAQTATAGAAGTAQQAAIQSLNLAAAEQRVVDAKRAALAAEQELTRARVDAKRAAEDLALASRNAALSEEDALLGVEEAHQRLAELRADPKADDLALRRAELAVRQAEQRAKEASVRNKRTQQEQRAADKAGIEGSAQVVAAKKKIEQANRRVEDAERSLRVMQLQAAAAAKTAAAAQRGTVAEMVKLSPAAAAAAKQIEAFKSAYLSWQQRLEPAVLPVITGGLGVLQTLFKPLTPLIKGTAGALVELEKGAQKALGGKFWQGFFKDLSKQAPTAVTGLGKSLGNVATGVAGIIRAFLPFTKTVVGGIEKATAAFARWGQGLGQSGGFQKFITFAKANAPLVLQVVKNLAAAGLNLVRALAPLGGTALAGIAGLASAIAAMDPQVLQAIVLGMGGLAAGIKAASTAMAVFNAVFKSGPIGLVVTALGLLVSAFIYAYQNSETFRTVVQAVFKAVATVVKWAWENVIKPAVTALVAFWRNVLGPAISWLWTNVVQPAFKKIGEFIKSSWTNVVQPALKALWEFITNTLAPKVQWFHENIVKPVFKAVGEAIAFAWEKVIKPAFSALWTFISETLPNGFKKGVELIGRFWDGLKAVAKAPVNFVIQTVYNNGIVKLWNTVADALGLKDAKLAPLPALATGGILPGYTPGRDVGLAAVSGGEAVMRPEWTRAVGSDFVHSANAAARSGGISGAARFMQERFAGGFASGGIVGDVLAKGVRAGAEAFLNPILDQAAKAMGDSAWGRLLLALPKKMVADVVTFLEGKEAAAGGPGAQKAIAFAAAQIGKPYKWGGTGPGSFDCSGLTMRAWQAGGRGDIPRTSQQQLGWVRRVAQPVPGALGFPNPGHVWMYVNPSTIIEAPQTGKLVRQVPARQASVIGVPPAQYDSGGFLPTGHSLVYNGTGAPEPVLTDRQWQAMTSRAAGGDGPMVNIEGDYVTNDMQTPQQMAQDLYWLAKSRPR